MSAGKLDMLEDAAIDAGTAAAEALARVERLERLVAMLVQGIGGINDEVGLPSSQFREMEREAQREARRERIARSGLQAVPGGAR